MANACCGEESSITIEHMEEVIMTKNEILGYLVSRLGRFKLSWLVVLKLLFDKLTVGEGDAVINCLSQLLKVDELSITVDRGSKLSLPSNFDRFYDNNPFKRPNEFSIGDIITVSYGGNGRFLNSSDAITLLDTYVSQGVFSRALTMHDGYAIVKCGVNVFTRVFGADKKVLLLGSCLYYKQETDLRIPILGVSEDGCTLTVYYQLITNISFSRDVILAYFKE